MGWFVQKTFRTKAEADKYAAKLRKKYRAAGHGRSMMQSGSYSVKVEKHKGLYEVMERA